MGFQHKVFLVPKDQFTMEYVEPKVHCISTHGQFSPDRYNHLGPTGQTEVKPDLTWKHCNYHLNTLVHTAINT